MAVSWGWREGASCVGMVVDSTEMTRGVFRQPEIVVVCDLVATPFQNVEVGAFEELKDADPRLLV